MTPIEPIPYGRGKFDVALYKYLRWRARRDRAELERGITQVWLDRLLYGALPPDVPKDSQRP